MLSLFFLSIGVTFASDVNYNENVNFEDKNILNNVNNEIYGESDASNVLNSNDQLNSDVNSSVDPINTSSDNLLNTNNSNTLNSNNTNVSSDGILNTDTSNVNTSNTTSSNVNSSNITNNLSSNNSTNQHESIKTDTEKKFAAGGDEKPSKLTQSQILNAASSVYKYIKKIQKVTKLCYYSRIQIFNARIYVFNECNNLLQI